MKLNHRTLEELGRLITGDGDGKKYRTGPQLVSFFNQLGFHDQYGQGFPSRNSYALDRIEKINGTPEIDRCIRMVFDPIEYIDDEVTLNQRIERFNKFLAFDNWKVLREGNKIRICSAKPDEKPSDKSTPKSEITAQEFLQLSYIINISHLKLDSAISTVLEQRISEISNCMKANANLAAVILTGSVLEGLLLALANAHPKEFNASKSAPKNQSGKVKKFYEWTLNDLIECACEVGAVEDDVKKFSHYVREYRNYIHPYQQMSSQFFPSQQTAEICNQVLKAAIVQAEKFQMAHSNA